MAVRNRIKRIKLLAGTVCFSAAWMVVVPPVFAQDARSGVSHPDTTIITATPDEDAPAVPALTKPKSSAAIPATQSGTVYGPYVPYRAPGTPATELSRSEAAFDPDANIVTESTAGRSERRLLEGPDGAVLKSDADAGIVTRVPSLPGQIPDGTLVKAKLREDLSTITTQPGTRFTAEVTEPVMREGRVIVPVGAMLEGRVTWVRGGKRIGGAAAIHLEPRTITLPDGGQYLLRARVVDTDHWDNTGVDDEGTITRKENGKKTLAAISLAAGGPMAAGAVIGGVPGAVIGAGVGAGIGTVVWLKQDRQAELPKDLVLIFSLTEPMSVTPLGAATGATIRTSGGE